jgi:CDP-alcohol phosphatidyltransferase
MGQPESVLTRRSEEHWTGTLYMRRMSPPVTWLALRLGLSANSVTMVMIVIGLGGVVVAALSGIATAAVAVVLIQVYLLLDCVDGEVARITRSTSARGVYLDRLGHYLVEGGLMVALGVRAAGDDQTWIIVGMAAALGVLVEKAETDLVPASRLRAGLGAGEPTAHEIAAPGLARARSAAQRLPLHMITHAAEASLLILVAAIADSIAGDGAFTRGLTISMAVVTGLVVALHLIGVWTSRRLD